MESSVQFQEFGQYAKQHTRFSAPSDSDLDFNERMYRLFMREDILRMMPSLMITCIRWKQHDTELNGSLKRDLLPQTLWHCVMT